MSLFTGLPSAIYYLLIGTNIPINIDICKGFMIYFQTFTTFRYKSLKKLEVRVGIEGDSCFVKFTERVNMPHSGLSGRWARSVKANLHRADLKC